MACNSLLSLNFIPVPSLKITTHFPFPKPQVPFKPFHFEDKKKELLQPKVASIPFPPINVDYLEDEFSGHGVTFERIGDDCIVKLGLESGSLVTLMLPSGLVTSYKAPMWHGGKMELLHTCVSEGESREAIIQGGLSLAFILEGEDGVSWSTRHWVVSSIKGSPEETIQVDLTSADSEGMVEVRYILTLEEEVLGSEIQVSNSGSSPIKLTGSVISHLNVSTPDATYAYGLAGSDFYKRTPFSSEFAILPPESSQQNELNFNRLWSKIPVKAIVFGNSNNGNKMGEAKRGTEDTEEIEGGEEDDNYKHLKERMSLVYTSAPTNFTIIDRGRRNSVVVRREKFDELYIFSPGSRHDIYNKYSYICVGQCAMLKPITVGPRKVWRGGQHLLNPNV